jgi:hypothetical protein
MKIKKESVENNLFLSFLIVHALYSLDPVRLPRPSHRQKDHQGTAARRRWRQIRHPAITVKIHPPNSNHLKKISVTIL